MPELTVSNFSLGWKDTPALSRDKIYSLRQLINADIEYERGALRRRNGYKRYHSANLPGLAKQVYEFVDTAGQTRLLAIAKSGSNYRLYLVETSGNNEIKNYSTSPTTHLVFDNYDSYPFKTVGDRVFFADDNDWYWTDYSSAKKGAGPYTYECYQVGVDAPVNKPGITNGELDTPPASEQQNISTLQAELYDITSPRMFAQSFKPKYYQNLDGVTLRFTKKGTPHGSIRVRVETDDSNNPSGTLLSDTSLSGWDCDITTDITATLTDVPDTIRFMLNALVDQLVKDTTYWYVVEVTQEYVETEDVDNHIAISGNASDAYTRGEAKYWNGSAWATLGTMKDVYFQAGLTPSWEWGDYTAPFNNENHLYKIALQNSTYVSESIPSPSEQTWVDTSSYKTGKIAIPSVDDEQVDTVTIYRTHGAPNTDSIGETYYYVGKVPITESYFLDVAIDDLATLECQSVETRADKHQRLQDANGNLLTPRYLEHWQNRLWVVPDDSKVMYFSKQLEERGALGIAGDAIHDYYPADNKWTLDSEIRSIRVLEDRLIVYTSNNNVHVYDGANSPLNPPPDLVHQEILVGDNCYDDRSLVELMGRHIFVTANKEVKAFNGSNILEPISRDYIQDSMSNTGDKYCAVVYNGQYLLAVDTDGDDVLDAIYIFDPAGKLPAWRAYQYLDRNEEALCLYGLFVTNDGALLAAPAQIDDSVYRIIQLDSGYSDDWVSNESDGIDITKILQTHYIMPTRRAKWHRFSMKGYYPHGARYGEDFFGGGEYGGDAVIPTLTLTAIGKDNYFVTNSLSPTSSDDARGHTCGLRIASEECSVRLDSKGDKPDEVREIKLEWRF